MDESQIKSFIYTRALAHHQFKAVIAVAVQRHASEFSATIWVGQEPTPEMRQFAYELETELANLGISCTIIVKTDRQLPFGGTYELVTGKGRFLYRYFKLDPVKDEDLVYVFTLYKGPETHRFRCSLTGTLASMLRARNRLDEDGVVEVYLDRIKARLGAAVPEDGIQDIMFNSTHLNLFTSA
jgi:hypothetical protein